MRLRMLLLPAVASIALLAGCTGTPTPEATPTTNGLDALEADEILQRTTDALDAAGSFRLTGSGEAEGEAVEIDAVFAGDLLSGTFTMTGFEVEIIVAQEGTFIKAGEDMWESMLPLAPADAQALLPLLSGKYVKIPSGMDGGLIPASGDFLQPEGEFTKGEVTEYNGQPAITLVDSESTLYISLVGEPYPLAVESPEGTIEFSEFGENAEIEAPAEGDVLDLEQLMG